MATLYFDCFSGAAGDMLVGALIDAGADFEKIRAVLGSLELTDYAVGATKIRKQGFAATQFSVDVDPAVSQPHRHLSDIRAILNNANLDPSIRETADQIFTRLAEAEAAAHGIDVEKVHFHEVGAVDSIVDIVAAAAAISQFGATRICCSPIVTGIGTVRCDHGVMPVPAPATAHLLRSVPLATSDQNAELITPTAAAILTQVCDQFGVLPAMTIERIGMGAGTRDNPDRPNLMRVLVGSDSGSGFETDTVAVIEANLDDCSGEWMAHCVSRLMESGARDAFTTPTYMKKGRPGFLLTVLCEPGQAEKLEAIIFAETTTFGVRRHLAERRKLRRKIVAVSTRFGDIRIKRGAIEDGAETVSPEFEDCVAAARRCGVAVRVVADAAVSAWRKGSANRNDSQD